MNIVGPAWTRPGSGQHAGRYPLAVERPVLSQVARLLPGVTTVTPHGRYYALHGLIADVARKRNLADIDARTLLRRMEVSLAAVSVMHEQAPSHEGLSRAHGAERIKSALQAGVIDVAHVAEVGDNAWSYAKAKDGFLPPYLASEVLLGILTSERFTPGPRYDARSVQPALEPLLSLAEMDYLDDQTLKDNVEVCICQGTNNTDGAWLAGLLAPIAVGSDKTRASTRKETIRMMARAMQIGDIANVGKDMAPLLMFGAASMEDPVLRQLAVTPAWQGTALRNESVTQWRALWAWLVSEIGGETTRSSLGDALADHFAEGTVGSFVNALPPLRDADGFLAPAERQPAIMNSSIPVRAIATIALGGLRAVDLNENALLAFHGSTLQEQQQELGPLWVKDRLTEWADRPMKDFVRDLTHILINRSQRIALRKASRNRATGELRIPSRVYVRDQRVFKDSSEGAGAVGLRWDQLASVLAETGVLRRSGGHWLVTDMGEHVLS